MSITLLTLTNTTSETIGPYGLRAITIPANSSLGIQPPLDGILADNAFILDLLAGNVVPSIGGAPIPGGSVFQLFALLSQADLSNFYINISGNSTTTVKSGSGILHAVIVGDNNTGGTVVIYDNTSNSGTVIMSLQLGSPSGGLLSSAGQSGPVYLNALNLGFSMGITVVTSGSSDNNITLIYQ